MAGSDLVSTERAVVTPHLHVGALAGAEYLHSTGSSAAPMPAVENRVAAFASATFGLYDRLQLGLSVPFVLSQTSTNLTSSALGDLRADARVRLAGPVRLSGVRVAAATSLSLPTGSTEALSGDGSVGFAPRVIVEWARPGGFVLALNAGVSLHSTRSLATLALGSEITARVGFTLPASKRFWFTLEAFGTTPFADPTHRALWSAETLFGLHWWSRQGFVLALAAGPRILAGVGTSDVRAVLLAGYAFDAPDEDEGPGDRDADGVFDADDECPTEPAGRRPDPRRRGCPLRDTDRDGVSDDRDLCPTDPEGDDPDPRRLGCPRNDQDMDGVSDARDECPTEPIGDHADPEHRGCPLRDGDGDGVSDSLDVCPQQPAGAVPDAARRGCPDPDIDHDRVLNERDACPEDPGVQTTDPRTNGCPRVRVSGDSILISQQPRFRPDHDVIQPESFGLLSEVQAVLVAHPEITGIEVQGHTDDRSSDEHNNLLSERRAQSIVRWLVEHDIAPSRLTARGYGETRPLVDNTTERGRAMNRRVEFHITARGNPP